YRYPCWNLKSGRHCLKLGGRETCGRFDEARDYFLPGDSSSPSSAPKLLEIPSSRSLSVSPMPASTPAMVSLMRFSTELARVSRTVWECCTRVVTEASSQELEAFSRRALYCSIDSSVDFFSCSIQSLCFFRRSASQASTREPSRDCRCACVCSRPTAIVSSRLFRNSASDPSRPYSMSERAFSRTCWDAASNRRSDSPAPC